MGERKLRDERLAVLIDADNASASLIEPLLEEVAKYGTANVKRIYGDWTQSQLKGWKEKLHIYAIQPIQQYSHTSGKNATDSALIIDAMELMQWICCIQATLMDFAWCPAIAISRGWLVD